MFSNQQCRHWQPSNIKPLSLHQQSMRVVNPTHTTQHEHEDFQERTGPANEENMYCTLGSEGAEVELRDISTG
jgi:hypothetical protein